MSHAGVPSMRSSRAALSVSLAALLVVPDLASAQEVKTVEDFLRAGDRLASWGRFTLDLLAAEAFPAPNAINLRDAAARALARRPGGPEQASADLAGNDPPRRAWTAGRAGRRVAALATIVARVLREP